MSKQVKLEAAKPGRRRRYTPEQKRALLDEAERPGNSISGTARRYGVAPSLLFQWKRIMDDASDEGLAANEKVVPLSELRKAEQRIKDLEQALGRKTLENEILTEAVRISGQKKRTSRGSSLRRGGGK